MINKFLLFTLCSCCFLGAEEEIIYPDIRLVNTPVLGIYAEPNSGRSYDTQEIYGHKVRIIGQINDEWVKIETEDGYQGYAQTNKLIVDNPLWRANNDLHRITGLIGCVYPEASLCKQTILQLPYNAYVRYLQNHDIDADWAQIQLADGKMGWIMRGDIEKIRIISKQEALQRAHMFIGLPYIWGGTSSFGFDCSGFVQTLARQIGYPMQRDARPQAHDPHLVPIAFEEIKPGDFVYFGKKRITHVSICIEPGKIIHAAGTTASQSTPRLAITDINHPDLVFQCARRLPPLEYHGANNLRLTTH